MGCALKTTLYCGTLRARFRWPRIALTCVIFSEARLERRLSGLRPQNDTLLSSPWSKNCLVRVCLKRGRPKTGSAFTLRIQLSVNCCGIYLLAYILGLLNIFRITLISRTKFFTKIIIYWKNKKLGESESYLTFPQFETTNRSRPLMKKTIELRIQKKSIYAKKNFNYRNIRQHM